MKQLVYILFMITVFLLKGCYIDNSVDGNGNVTEEIFETATFDKIQAGHNFDVILIPSDNEKVVVTMDENLFDYTEIGVKNGKLIIRATRNFRKVRSKVVKVYYKNINRLDVSSAANVTSNSILQADKLSLDVSSAGDVELELQCNELQLDVSSAGNAKLKGKVSVLKANVSSAGGINAFGLKADKADIVASSAGDVKIYIDKEASLESSSGGTIKYRGNPSVIKHSESSGGNIKHVD
jgi:hypothetical protein